MIKKTYLILIFFSVVCLSCEETKEETILKSYYIEEVFDEKREICIDSISQNISIIHLETTDEILIDIIRSIHMYNDLLFVLHKNRCSVFDLEGKFLYHIGNEGSGPGEYNFIEDIFFIDGQVIIHDGLGWDLLFYNINSDFTHSISFREICTDINVINGSFFVLAMNPHENNRIKLFDINGTAVDSIKQNEIFLTDYSSSITNDSKLFIYNDSLYFKEAYNDTVFRISQNMQLIPEYAINTGKYSVNYEDRMQSDREKYRKGKSPVIFFENNRFIVLRGWGFGYQYGLIDKKNEKISYVDFVYNEKMAELFERDSRVVGAKNNNNDFNNLDLLYEDAPPSFRICGVSENGKILMDFEYLKDHPADNPVIVLVELEQ